jgi:hypothetical protein
MFGSPLLLCTTCMYNRKLGGEYPVPLFVTGSEANKFGSPLLLRNWYTYNGKMGVEYPTPLFATDSEANRFGSPLLLRDRYTYTGKMGVEHPTPLSVTKGEANRSGGPPRMRTPYTCNGKGVKSTHSHCLLQMVRPRGLAAHHRYALHTRTTGKWVWSTHGCGVPNPIAR